jgi:hypothetical protein
MLSTSSLLYFSLIINNIKLRHVLVDGGASLNILSMYALDEMQTPHTKLIDRLPFEVISLSMFLSIGYIKLPFTFGTHMNFHMKYVEFIIIELHMSYHTILRCPMLFRFMVLIHYG